MTLDPDPYRTLGLSRGATLDEVKRAYRRLAKANHPDAAGEGALPRFLAIQAAYEQLAGGWVPPRTRGATSTPRRPWQADPDRGDATRRAYGGRPRGPRPGTTGGPGTTAGPGTSSRPGGPGKQGTTGGPGTTSGPGTGGTRSSRGTSGARADGPGPGTGGRRGPSEPRPGAHGPSDGPGSDRTDGPPNKATLGSTSYDGADSGPFEPDWGGASWYGTTSGTYWTLNPKEYADPRKHGPEYQARARRTARARGAASTGAPDPSSVAGGPTPDEGPGFASDHGHGTGPGDTRPADRGPANDPDARPTHTTSSWWDSTAGSTGVPPNAESPSGEGSPPQPRGAAPATAAALPPDLGRAAADLLHTLVDERSGGLRGRILRAVIGWLPIAFGFGWLVGELTGCGRFAATCDGTADPFVLLVQFAALIALLLIPTLAAVASMASIALLSTAVVAAVILSATGAAADTDSRRVTLGALLVVAWLAGLVLAIVDRVRTLRVPTRPVS
jgi:hypothetical protein